MRIYYTYTTFFSQLVTAISYTLCSLIMRTVRLSFILGSKAAFFSLSQCLLPAVGFFACPTTTVCAYSIRVCTAFLLMGISPLTALVYHIPSFCAALYLSTTSQAIKIALPMICMAIFMLHPTGSQAWAYSLYWLIPVALALIPSHTIYLQAVGSTFTAHAVGSVLWLFTHNLTPADWQSLIGVVWAERLLFAACITACYYIVTSIQAGIRQIARYTPVLQRQASQVTSWSI